eukprot:c12454_g1_i1.p1 GENE.c12454_g1_i1~~c12454_g1_i1.p1  ORF type:complete len:104 (+),score=11.49 c12454_g1_i1:191-502(+)
MDTFESTSARAKKVYARKMKKDDEKRAFLAKEKEVKSHRDELRRNKEVGKLSFEEEEILSYSEVMTRKEEKAKERREFAASEKEVVKSRTVDRKLKNSFTFEE